jgi:ATP-dependent DNA helicase RecG
MPFAANLAKRITSMNEIKIKELIKCGESATLEFKEAGRDSLPSSLFDTICAFLNTEGGIILLGVKDNGEISGVNPDCVAKLKIDIANLANNPQKLDPVFIIGASDYDMVGKIVIAIQVPVSSMVHRSGGEVFLRNDEGDYRVKQPEMIAGIVNRKLSFFTEQRVYPDIKLSDFSPALFDRARFLMRGRNHNHPWLGLSNKDLLQKAHLFGKDHFTGKTGYTLAAILLFGSDDLIETVLPAYKFDALLRRENVDRYDDRLLLRTNIIDTYDRLMEFIEKHLNDPFHLEGDVRISLREKIFRELVSNIIAHREYADTRPATIMIYKDRVEFKNPNHPNGKKPDKPQLFCSPS